jgi:hypothetical protein
MYWRIPNFKTGAQNFFASSSSRIMFLCRRKSHEPRSPGLPQADIRSLVLFLSLPQFSTARIRPVSALNSEYVAALKAADRFLQAWQAADSENGVALFTNHAKDAATTDAVDRFFSTGAPEAYEIGRGKLLKHGRHEFPVVLVSGAPNRSRVRRRFSNVVIVNTGKNDWAVDKLP